MITIISLLLQLQSICSDFKNFGHDLEWIELEGVKLNPCVVKETDKELIELHKKLDPNKIYKIKYKTDSIESYFLTTIGGE